MTLSSPLFVLYTACWQDLLLNTTIVKIYCWCQTKPLNVLRILKDQFGINKETLGTRLHLQSGHTFTKLLKQCLKFKFTQKTRWQIQLFKIDGSGILSCIFFSLLDHWRITITSLVPLFCFEKGLLFSIRKVSIIQENIHRW